MAGLSPEFVDFGCEWLILPIPQLRSECTCAPALAKNIMLYNMD